MEDHPELKETLSGYDIGSFSMVGLGAAAAAGAVPKEHQVTLTDENTEEINYSLRPDAVCLSFFTPQATNAYAIGDKFRQAGVLVISGGIHPTMAPEDTLKHVDCVIRGPVEGLWEEVLEDLRMGKLKRIYQGSSGVAFTKPRRELFSESKYLRAGVVQTARGCSMGCEFCVVPGCYGSTIKFRPIDEVLEDISSLPFPCFFFADENLLFPDVLNKEYSKELFSKMVERKFRRISFTANYPQFLKRLEEQEIALAAKAKMQQVYLVLGLKRPLKEELIDKELERALWQMKNHGIEVLASFTLGHDEDDEPVEALIEDFKRRTETNLAEFVISTPFPGTPTFEQYKKQGRILTERWERYNGANVVFSPLHESPEALRERYLRMWRWFYQDISQGEVKSRYVRGFGGDILRE